MTATTYPRHARPDNRKAPAYLHYSAMLSEMVRGDRPGQHASQCPCADDPSHETRCAIEPRLSDGTLRRPTGVVIAVATREMRAGR